MNLVTFANVACELFVRIVVTLRLSRCRTYRVSSFRDWSFDDAVAHSPTKSLEVDVAISMGVVSQ